MAQLLPNIKQQFFDQNGDPLAGGKIFSYVVGTSTLQATYTDYGAGTPNSNPIILDANGEASIWLGTNGYKFVIKDSNDVVLDTIDNVFQLPDGLVTTSKLADGALSADTDGRAKIATGYFSADSTGRGKFADGFITRAKQAPVGQQISVSCTFDTTETDYTDVTDMNVTITTTGRPVILAITSAAVADDESYLSISTSTSSGDGSLGGKLRIMRDATMVYNCAIQQAHISTTESPRSYFPPGIIHLDTPAAGTYVYKVQVARAAISGSHVYVNKVKLVAVEL